MPANKAKDRSPASTASPQSCMTTSPRRRPTRRRTFIGATPVWPSLGGSQKAGQGVKVGVLDTGIWPEHPSFADPGISHPGGTYACEFGLSGDADRSGANFACNDKLIGAYAFLETQLEFTDP